MIKVIYIHGQSKPWRIKVGDSILPIEFRLRQDADSVFNELEKATWIDESVQWTPETWFKVEDILKRYQTD